MSKKIIKFTDPKCYGAEVEIEGRRAEDATENNLYYQEVSKTGKVSTRQLSYFIKKYYRLGYAMDEFSPWFKEVADGNAFVWVDGEPATDVWVEFIYDGNEDYDGNEAE